MAVVEVNGPSPYKVHIGHSNLSGVAERVGAIGARKVLIVHQVPLAAVAREICRAVESANVECVLAPVPDAEAGKTMEVLSGLWELLGEKKFSRQDVVIGVGGGAATDLAGFVAATWMRGIKVIQVPTSLLGMVDAAVGGKTGINTAAGKNLVGSFHEPDSVFIDLERLITLPEEELISGSAELIKTGFIADPRILELYMDDPQAHYAELVERSVAVKASVVSQDLKESGLREILNYGHTLGHAIELRENYTWRHGNAVAVGMMFVAHLARNRGLIGDDIVDMHRNILERICLPTTYEAGAFDELYEAMTRDKKNRDGRVRFVVLDGLGSCTRIEDSTIEEMRDAYSAIS
ncbi:3-dehydroquinate synthase [Corynebacterium sanguinis]|uniref:3-dehydroquinate synthase n=1 Tax=Corynebacterium sanguinis TaxID=2594913 RepID=UPI0021A718DF|nr:3-dehydroquinate synthase [Corynebacterium sanguinis]MCT1444014.1 3-dehydroquinate synthase [Corynebacterium sanguinis]MCT1492258.1 3-dehydroquinate synthase [Corynebacterium sanguinis]MCT2247195.1 3-dehydroquinate synthase [Corynebacterium sanguinis]